jgi:hypothetical protein
MVLKLKDGIEINDVASIDHAIDSECRQVFEDLISRHNALHWDPMSIEHFLLTPGKLVSRCITHTPTEMPEALTTLLASGQFKNIEKLIVCTYSSPFGMALENFGKMMNGISDSVPAGVDISCGWITEDRAAEDRVAVHLIAICSRTADEALFFLQIRVSIYQGRF